MPTLADTTVLDAFRRWGYLEAQLDPVPDAPHLFGLDRRGTIRGYYDALAADGVTQLLVDTNHVLREQPK